MIHPNPTPQLDDMLPPMTYRDLAESLEMVATYTNRSLVTYLVSALREQAPFLTGRMVLFEILRSGNCMADEATSPPSIN